MRTERIGVSETNSSSAHAFSVITKEDTDRWHNGYCYLYIDYDWLCDGEDAPEFEWEVSQKISQKVIYTVEETKAYFEKRMAEDIVGWDWLTDNSKSKRENIIAWLEEVIRGDRAFNDEELTNVLADAQFYTEDSLQRFTKGMHFMPYTYTTKDLGNPILNGLTIVGYSGRD